MPQRPKRQVRAMAGASWAPSFGAVQWVQVAPVAVPHGSRDLFRNGLATPDP
jgi:hypothetical protein